MVTATLVFMALLLIVLAGEAVRGQCRRMLAQPAQATAPVSDSVVRPMGSQLAG